MQSSNSPTPFSAIFANAASAAYITKPIPAAPTGVNGSANLQQGFPPAGFVSVQSGGAGPFGADMNGILYQLTGGLQWLQAGMLGQYNAAFSSDIGGYPKGAIVMSAATAGLMFQSTVDNNTSDPDSGGAGWTSWQFGDTGQGLPAGVSLDFAGSAAPSGYFLENGAAISRTTYANLYSVIGTTYGAGDGSTTFNLPNAQSRVIVGVGTGPSLSSYTLGQTGGEETHTMTLAELVAHTHTYTNYGANPQNQSGGTGSGAGYKNTGQVTSSEGSGNAFNVIQPYIAMNKIIKY